MFKKQQKPQEIWLEITSGSKSKIKEKKEDETNEIYIPPEKRQQIIDALRHF